RQPEQRVMVRRPLVGAKPERRTDQLGAHRDGLVVGFFSASVNGRTRMARTAPLVFQVAKPNGLHGSHSRRIVSFFSDASRFTTWSSSIHACTRSFVTRMRTLYHRSEAN